MEENKNIEQQLDSMFRDNLNNAQVPAPEGIWESIVQNIPQPTVSPSIETVSNTTNNLFSSISTISKIAIIATTAAITGLSVYLINSDTKQNNKTEIESVIEKNALETKTTSNEIESIKTDVAIIESNEIIEEVAESKTNTNKSHNNSKTSPNKNSAPSKSNHSQNNPTPHSIKSDIPTKAPATPAPPIIRIEENQSSVLSDTIICYSTLFKPSWSFGQSKVSSQQIIIDSKTYTSIDASILNSIKNKWITVRGNLLNGEKVERRVKLSSSQIELSVSNASEDAAYCQILNGNLFTHTLWFINSQLIEEDVKHIVYYRNMEFETGTAINLKIVSTNENACKDSILKDISSYMIELSEPVIPNVITPNNDGLNDKWDIQISGEVYYNVKVLGINNSIIFQSNNKDNKWNGLDIQGNIVPEGSYLYVVEYQFPNQKIQTKSGLIQLIRN